MDSRGQYHFKLVLLGNAGVGKSCLVLRFTRDEFFADQESTIGAAFLTKSVRLEDASTVKIEIWDTAGQERYRSLAPMYYRGAQAAIIVFDLTSRESYDGSKSWVKELQRRADPNLVIALVGNKADLRDKRVIEADEANEYAKSQNLFYMETSAKDATNVENVFTECARRVPKVSNTNTKRDVVPLRPGTNATTNTTGGGAVASKGCCG